MVNVGFHQPLLWSDNLPNEIYRAVTGAEPPEVQSPREAVRIAIAQPRTRIIVDPLHCVVRSDAPWGAEAQEQIISEQITNADLVFNGRDIQHFTVDMQFIVETSASSWDELLAEYRDAYFRSAVPTTAIDCSILMDFGDERAKGSLQSGPMELAQYQRINQHFGETPGLPTRFIYVRYDETLRAGADGGRLTASSVGLLAEVAARVSQTAVGFLKPVTEKVA
jgi:hypothetical protein